MANTYTLISTLTVGSGGSSTIDFTSIPQTYNDLCLLVSGRDSTYGSATSTAYARFNNDSSTSYKNLWLFNNGGTAGSTKDLAATVLLLANQPGTSATSNTFSNALMYIPNYTSSNYKPISVDNVMENNSVTVYETLLSGLWSSASAINRITLSCDGAFAQYSSASLYGIKSS